MVKLSMSLLALTIALPFWTVSPVQAQSSSSFARRLRTIFSRPPSSPATNRPRGASIRSGTCQATNPPLTALIPVEQTLEGNPIVLGTTTSEYPTLWFYLPYAITPDRPAELRREDPDPTDQASVQQRTVLRLTGAPAGVIGLRLPPTEPPLAINQFYNWIFVVRCDPQDASTNQFVAGSIVRLAVTANLSQQVARSDPNRRSQFYAEAGIWQEAIAALVELRRRSPNDSNLAAEWANLLQSADLNTIVSKPIVECCESEK
ncbi:MAG: DUF928 domain-containing protein [Leptolyngbyaceae cyanobacterium CSU_1_3]|nr:DUF928 domain-containing protein [Leptolyngbyaceae cyanobacterium CSU_1_3]